jgi:hypothetical protein
MDPAVAYIKSSASHKVQFGMYTTGIAASHHVNFSSHFVVTFSGKKKRNTQNKFVLFVSNIPCTFRVMLLHQLPGIALPTHHKSKEFL